MNSKTTQKLLAKIELMEVQLQDLKKMVKTEVVKKEWYTTEEVAARTGIKKKTAANYCSNGTYRRVRKKNSRWRIHESELR